MNTESHPLSLGCDTLMLHISVIASREMGSAPFYASSFVLHFIFFHSSSDVQAKIIKATK
jgi:hypothetical protein